MSEGKGAATEPIPCFDRPRCRAPKPYLVEAGTWTPRSPGHLVGARSCLRHLGETVAYATANAQPVRVINFDSARPEQREAMRAALGELPPLAV